MHVWVALIVSALTLAAVILVAYLLMRTLFPGQLDAIFAIGEEKLSLTKSDSRANYFGQDTHKSGRPDSLGGQDNRDFSPGQEVKISTSDAENAAGRGSPGDTTGSEHEPCQALARAGSAESLASDTSVMDLQPDVSMIGQVEIGLEYDREISELVVSLIQARDLAAGDPALCELDFYAAICVQPDAANVKSQTKLIHRNPCPTFKERFLYSLESHQMSQKSVHVLVYSVDKTSKHRLIGQTEIRLIDIDLSRPLRLWLNLREKDQKPSDFGELMFSLSYLPTAERLTLVIVKAKNLKWPRPEQTVGDVFVKVHLILNGKRLSKKKTSVKKGESQPTYNEAMIFNVPQANLSSVQLRLTVAEMSPDGRARSVGHVIIGSQTGGTELTHWQQMVTSLRKPVAMWHHLRKQ